MKRMCSPSLDGDSLRKAKGLKTREFGSFLGSLCLYTSTKPRVKSLEQHKDVNHTALVCACEKNDQSLCGLLKRTVKCSLKQK